MFMFKYPDDPCSSRTWYPAQVRDVLISILCFCPSKSRQSADFIYCNSFVQS